LRLYLEQKPNLKALKRKELVRLIIDRLNVSPATAYHYAKALKILVQGEEDEERRPLEDSWRPLGTTGARSRFEAIKIMAGTVEPPLIRKMKEYGMTLWKDVVFGGIPLPCNRYVFGNAFGLLIEKVGNVALLDPDFAHAPKDLAEACFIKLVEEMNPYMEVRGLNPAEDALCYVEWVLAYKARRQEKSKKRTSFISQEEQTSGPEYLRVEVVFNRNKQVKSKYLKGLDIWFILPGEAIANALIKYCFDKEVYWQDAVRNLLTMTLKDGGYL